MLSKHLPHESSFEKGGAPASQIMGFRMPKGQAFYLLGLFVAVSLEPDFETTNTRTESVLLDAPQCPPPPPQSALPCLQFRELHQHTSFVVTWPSKLPTSLSPAMKAP